MKLLWLDLNSSYAHSSLALPALHAQIGTNRSMQWEVVSATINENVGMIVQKMYAHRPDILLASCWLFNHEVLLHIISRVKALLPSCCVILGGPEFLGNNADFLRRNVSVDCVFRGEGEESFPVWLQVWNQKKEWKDIPGLCYLTKEEGYCDNGTARVKGFASLVSPLKSQFFNWDKPFVQLETTRGCFNTCAFCVSGGEKPVRTLSIEEVRARLDEIQKRGIKNVRVLDRTFNYNLQHAKELLMLFLSFSPHICFHLEMHPALLSNELREMLSVMPEDLLHLEAGIQSLRKNVLEKSGRKGKLADALDGLQFLCTLETMETHADLIAGLPLYSLSEIFEDVRTLAHYGAGEIQLELLKLLPGTAMRRDAEMLGIRYSPFPPYEVLETGEITVDELQTARLLSRLLDGFYNAPVWRSITQMLIVENPEFLQDFLAFLIEGDVIENPLSIEKRGLLLYEYCKKQYPEYQMYASAAWIEAGLSLKKIPAECVKVKRELPSQEEWKVVYGQYRADLRFCYLPLNAQEGCWYGFEPEIQKPKPSFKAISPLR